MGSQKLLTKMHSSLNKHFFQDVQQLFFPFFLYKRLDGFVLALGLRFGFGIVDLMVKFWGKARKIVS